MAYALRSSSADNPFHMASLTAEQVAFFKDAGFLILKGMLDPDLCDRALDRLWDALPAGSRMRRDDPRTHVGPFPPDEESRDPLHIRAGYLWQLRECGTEPLLLDLTHNAQVWAVAEQLLGEGMLAAPTPHGMPMGSEGPAWPGGPTDPAITDGIRGIYCTRPYEDAARRERKPGRGHTDGHPFHLGVVGLLADVPPDGGAFKVWPHSHRRLYHTFQMQYDQPRIPYYRHLPSHRGILHSPGYLTELDQVMADTEPVDCWGERGDIVLWHHRLAHMAGHNYSDVMRQAVLYDFSRTDLDRCRMDPPQENMWRDWSEEVRNTNCGYSVELARTMRV